MLSRFLVILIVVISCSRPIESDKIAVPSLDQNYYLQSVTAIEERIRQNPEDLKLIKLQLAYYDQLDWPLDALSALDRAGEVLKFDPLFIDQRIAFYKKHNRKDEFLALLKELEASGELPSKIIRDKIDLLVENEEIEAARNEIELLLKKADREDLAYIAIRKIEIGDTVGGIEIIGRLDVKFLLNKPDIQILFPALDLYDYHKLNAEILEAYLTQRDDLQINRMYARSLRSIGDTSKAKHILSRYSGKDEVMMLASWYQTERKWDSVHYILSKILLQDPNDIDALKLSGDVDHERGFLSRSLTSYNKVLEIDSTDQYVLDQIDLVSRKIAYLQKIREASKDIPVLDLTSKRANN